jgi:hypothetical protein
MAQATERPMFRGVLPAMAALALGSVWLVAGCGESGSSSESSSVAAQSSAASSTAQSETFVSKRYRYKVNSTDWMGSQAGATWNGKSATGDGDPTVDALYGPRLRRVWVVSAPTNHSLQASVAALRKANVKAHPCPKTPEQIHERQIDGEPAIVDAMHCPPSGGVFALNAFAKHDGRIYLFFTYDQPGREAYMQRWFGKLLDSVSFDV